MKRKRTAGGGPRGSKNRKKRDSHEMDDTQRCENGVEEKTCVVQLDFN